MEYTRKTREKSIQDQQESLKVRDCSLKGNKKGRLSGPLGKLKEEGRKEDKFGDERQGMAGWRTKEKSKGSHREEPTSKYQERENGA